MSLINKFTIGFNKDKGKRRSIIESHNSTLKIKSNSEETNKNVLSQELLETLITFGFDLKQLIIAHKEYKFSNLDEACYYLMKDNETGKYNHRFLIEDKNENFHYSNLNNNLCVICSGDPTEHRDYNLEDKKLISTNNQNNNDFSSSNYNGNINVSDIDKIKKVHSHRNKDINLDVYRSNDNLNEKIEENDSNILNNEDKLNNIHLNLGNNNTVLNSENNENKSQINNKTNPDINSTSLQINKNIIDDQNNLKKAENQVLKIKNVLIDIPPETLDLFDDPDVCRICFSEKITTNNQAQFACGHKFCRKCVTNYLTNAIMNGKVNFVYIYNLLFSLIIKKNFSKLLKDEITKLINI